MKKILNKISKFFRNYMSNILLILAFTMMISIFIGVSSQGAEKMFWPMVLAFSLILPFLFIVEYCFFQFINLFALNYQERNICMKILDSIYDRSFLVKNLKNNEEFSVVFNTKNNLIFNVFIEKNIKYRILNYV